MNNTPRTDEQHAQFQMGGFTLDFARQLERELATVTEQRDKLAVNNNKVIELLKDGLQTDGPHHKQWYLNEVLKLIDPDIAKDVEGHWTHDGGIAP
jgi:hypothetical protein